MDVSTLRYVFTRGDNILCTLRIAPGQISDAWLKYVKGDRAGMWRLDVFFHMKTDFLRERFMGGKTVAG